MELLELFKMLHDTNAADKQQQQIEAIVKQLQIQQQIIDSNYDVNKFIFVLTMFAILAACLILRRELVKKNKQLEKRIALLEKMDPKAG